MKILMTGGSGFVGKHFQEYLKPYKDICINLIKFNYQNFEILNDDTLFSEQADVLLLLGWHVAKNKEEETDIEKNFLPLIFLKNLLDKFTIPPKKLIFVSSVEVYGRHVTEYLTEASVCATGSLYGISKLYGELMVQEWAKHNNVRCQILRLGPIYGPGDKRRGYLLDQIIQSAIYNKTFNLNMSLDTRRNLLFVDDACEFIWNSIQGDSLDTINIVSEWNSTIGDIIQYLKENNSDFTVVSHGDEMPEILFNAEKRIRILGKEKVSLKEGIYRYYKWMRERAYENLS